MPTTDRVQVTALANTGYDPRIRTFRYGSIVDSFAVLTERYTVLIDTMVNPEAMVEVLKILDRDAPHRAPSHLVINTHGDWDHVWGNALFAGREATFPAPIIGSRLATEAMLSVEARDLLADYQAQYPGVYDRVAWEPPNIALDGGGFVAGGDLTLELISTPGHTPDHLAVWLPEIRVVLAGDAAEASMPYVNDPIALPQLRASLQRLQALDPAVVLACHAFGGGSPDLLTWNLAYFDELEGRCAKHAGSIEDFLADWRFEEAVPERWQPPADQLEFYRRSHARAADAMLSWLRGSDA